MNMPFYDEYILQYLERICKWRIEIQDPLNQTHVICYYYNDSI